MFLEGDCLEKHMALGMGLEAGSRVALGKREEACLGRV